MTINESLTLLNIEMLQLKKAAQILRAVNHELRQQILQHIHQSKRITVSNLYVQLGLEQSVASQHLAILRKAGFVNAERDRRFIFYSVNYARLKQVNEVARSLIQNLPVKM